MNKVKAQLIDGVALSGKIRAEIKLQAEEFERQKGRKIGLAVVLAGANPASAVYVRNKIKACEECSIKSSAYYLPESVTEKELCELITALNDDNNIDGILVQLPLPAGLDESKILDLVSYKKDVDGFHALNAGSLLLSKPCLTACTPSGVIEMLKSTGMPIEGKHAVVVGRSNIVGKPMAMLLLQNNATVTVCHSKTVNLAEITRTADILVAAIGKKEFITADMIKDGAVVIDVGMNRSDGKLCGDVDFEACAQKASFITPVPGGVGPMTITSLLQNTVKAAKLNG